jgi:hypothetical protein
MYVITIVNDWKIEQINVKIAFLYDKIHENVFVVQFTSFELGWPQGWVSDMSDSPIRSNPRVGQKILSDESDRVLAIVRRSNPIREIVRNLRLDKIR